MLILSTLCGATVGENEQFSEFGALNTAEEPYVESHELYGNAGSEDRLKRVVGFSPPLRSSERMDEKNEIFQEPSEFRSSEEYTKHVPSTMRVRSSRKLDRSGIL